LVPEEYVSMAIVRSLDGRAKAAEGVAADIGKPAKVGCIGAVVISVQN
jgi:hypothetical protein